MRVKGYPGKQTLAPGDKVTIYAFACEAFVKVGIARDAAQRLRQVQSANPFPVRLVASRRIRHEVAALAEALAHRELAAHHQHGEWFRCSRQEARGAIWRAVTAARRQHQPDPAYEAAYAARVAQSENEVRASRERIPGATPETHASDTHAK